MLTVHDFKVGMKVKAIASDPKGLIGEVKGLDADGTIAVAFEGFNGHTCFGSLEKTMGGGCFRRTWKLFLILRKLAVYLL